uniref:Uncharacterized protein n=1 Tax=Oryza rufipogon TaxID=4529 RepID=A0A0E0NE41_ORYRU
MAKRSDGDTSSPSNKHATWSMRGGHITTILQDHESNSALTQPRQSRHKKLRNMPKVLPSTSRLINQAPSQVYLPDPAPSPSASYASGQQPPGSSERLTVPPCLEVIISR